MKIIYLITSDLYKIYFYYVYLIFQSNIKLYICIIRILKIIHVCIGDKCVHCTIASIEENKIKTLWKKNIFMKL
jgi:hypothetical protein